MHNLEYFLWSTIFFFTIFGYVVVESHLRERPFNLKGGGEGGGYGFFLKKYSDSQCC